MKNGDILKLPFKYTLHTNGDGLWTSVTKAIDVTRIECHVNSFAKDDVDIPSEEKMWGELRVYFDTVTWKIEDDGLIYTDKGFIDELRGYLELNGLNDKDVDYSEQGMQGIDYVSLDVGNVFIDSWVTKQWLESPLVGA